MLNMVTRDAKGRETESSELNFNDVNSFTNEPVKTGHRHPANHNFLLAQQTVHLN